MTWVKIDIDELSRVSADIQRSALEIEASASRVHAACCAGGMGRHGATLAGEATAVSARLHGMRTTYYEFALEAVLRALVAALQERVASGVPTVGLGLAPRVAVTPQPTVWKPVSNAQLQDWLRKGHIDPLFVATALSPRFPAVGSTGGAGGPTAQKNMEQINNNYITNKMQQRLSAMQGVTKPIGIPISRTDLFNYQNNVTPIGYRGIRSDSGKVR